MQMYKYANVLALRPSQFCRCSIALLLLYRSLLPLHCHCIDPVFLLYWYFAAHLWSDELVSQEWNEWLLQDKWNDEESFDRPDDNDDYEGDTVRHTHMLSVPSVYGPIHASHAYLSQR